jgi:hypothetical protein
VAARPAPIASAAAKIGTGEAASCAQISPSDADIGGGPDCNVGDREGGVGGCNTARAGAGDRCSTVGGLGRSGPGTTKLVDSARAAPVVEVVPRADGVAPMAATRVTSAGVCPTMDRGSLSRALHAAIRVK